MSRVLRALPSSGTWLVIGAVATFLYGAEHWRRSAARRARESTQGRVHALTVCLLGPDGPGFVDSPSRVRQRLRALAVQTRTTPSPTWLDRCVPLARRLAAHGGEVDATGAPGSAATRVARRTRDLVGALSQIGLVWTVRVGDVEQDLDPLAELLGRTAAEVDLASDRGLSSVRGDHEVLVAPPVVPEAPSATVSLRGLVPLPHGGPSRFLVGAPLPLTGVATPLDGRVEVTALPHAEALYWRLGPQGLVRVDAQDVTRDGLAPVTVDTLEGRLVAGRVAPPPRGIDRHAVALDAVSSGRAWWLAEAVRGHPPVLARLSPAPATAVTLTPTPPERGLAAALSGPTTPANVDAPRAPLPDEDVAVTADSGGVWAAFTTHLAEGAVQVSLVRALGGARARVVPAGSWRVSGRRPGLTLCRAAGETWLFAASRRGWRAGVVRGGSLSDVASLAPREGYFFDESLTVRCASGSALVYGRERPRTSPLWRCHRADGRPSCEALPMVPSPQSRDLPGYVSWRVGGARVAHAEWPLSFVALAGGEVLAARAFGPLVAFARLTPGARRWEPERVLFDAASREHGVTVRGVELYAEGGRVALSTATADELRVSLSDDGGLSWRRP